jgi:immune inhibitor A
MKARVLFPTKLASGMLAGAVALLLISAAFSGLVWAIAGGEANQDRHPNGEATIVERSGQRPTENVGVNQPTCCSQSMRRTDASLAEENNGVRSRGFSAVRVAPHVGHALQQQGKKIKAPFPLSANRGRRFKLQGPFNPQGEVIGPLTTDPVQKILVICVEFTSPPPGGPDTRLDLHYFDDLLFGTVYDPPEYAPYPGHPTDRTLKNYYSEVSYGKVDVVTVNLPSTMGWAQSGHPYGYYCQADGIHDNGFGPYPQNVQGLVIEAIKAVDSVVDFSQYAVNGEVPGLIVVHAGTGAEWSSDPSIIWSHQWSLSDGTGLDGYWADGVKIDTYSMLPEVGGNVTGYWAGISGPFPPTVGVFAHEWGHVLGVPDQYDYGYDSDGTGNYSPMAGGNWCFSYPNPTFPDLMMFMGNSPTHLDAWSKYRLGFVTPVRVDPKKPVSAVLPPVEFFPVVYRMDVPNSGGREYFLLENRQHIGFDEGLNSAVAPPTPDVIITCGRGLAIWHIDDTVLTRNYWRPNEAANWHEFRWMGWDKAENGETHYGISIIQADDQWHLEQLCWWGGDPADLYPGTLGVTRFGSFTRPNSTSYYFWRGSKPMFGFSGVTVHNIEETAGVVTADLSFAR